MEGLEERVQCCTNTNNRLRERVDNLETENKSLLEQLKKLRSLVAHIYPSKLQAGTILMVLSLCFSLTVFPWPHTSTPAYSSSYHSVTGEIILHSLLHIHCDISPSSSTLTDSAVHRDRRVREYHRPRYGPHCVTIWWAHTQTSVPMVTADPCLPLCTHCHPPSRACDHHPFQPQPLPQQQTRPIATTFLYISVRCNIIVPPDFKCWKQ